jgi:two-component sensor histidine kinase
LLLRELTHRVNNEFAAAIGMVSIFAARAPDPEVKSLLSAVADRLHGYAQVHHSLTPPAHDDPIDAAAYLRRLCHSISRSKLEFRGIELRLVERAFWMGSERCWRLGVMISEIITNSARHAFDGQGGTIRVELQPLGALVRCLVADNGRGTETYRAGHGSSIIQAMADSLDGRLDQDFGPHGAITVLTFPAEPASAIAPSTPLSASAGAAPSQSQRLARRTRRPEQRRQQGQRHQPRL